MMIRKNHLAMIGMVALAGCSLGPRPQAALPQVRDVPVLAGLSPAESLARGRSFLASKQYGLAIELFKAAGRDPAFAADSFNGLAVAYDGIGRGDIAERYFQRALAARPDDGRVKRNLAAFYARSGQEAKRGQLLAGAATVAPLRGDAVTISRRSGSAAEFDAVAAFVASAKFPAAPALQVQSPLGGVFRPLLAGAILPASAVGPAPTEGTSIICESNGKEAGGDGDMTIFRISMGEVFIAPQPVGANCAVVGGTALDTIPSAERSMTNKEYLGLVASYLERIEALRAGPDISIAWRAAFWSQDDRV